MCYLKCNGFYQCKVFCMGSLFGKDFDFGQTTKEGWSLVNCVFFVKKMKSHQITSFCIVLDLSVMEFGFICLDCRDNIKFGQRIPLGVFCRKEMKEGLEGYPVVHILVFVEGEELESIQKQRNF